MNELLNEKQKRYLFNSVFAVVILLAIFLAAKSINSLKEYSYIGKGVYAANVITVSGKGEVLTIPDIAQFYYSVIEEAKTVKEAQDKASKKTNDILAAIRAMGVEDKDIKTTSYSSYPKYDYNRMVCPPEVNLPSGETAVSYPCYTGKQVLIGYEVNQTISVKIRKTDQAGEVLTKVGSLGASNISSLDFVIDNQDAVIAQARDKAIADAKGKAAELSKSLGVRLTKIVNFYESGQPIYYGMALDSAKGMGGDRSSVIPELPAGENKTVSNVTITYEVQ